MATFGKIIVRMIAILLFIVGLCIPALMQYLSKYGPEWCIYNDGGVQGLGVGFGITLVFFMVTLIITSVVLWLRSNE